MVECLYKNSANINLRDSQGNSPFMLALKKGEMNSILLCQMKKSLNIFEKFNLGNDEVTLLLIKFRADFHLLRENWGSALFGCITRNGKINLEFLFLKNQFHFLVKNSSRNDVISKK